MVMSLAFNKAFDRFKGLWMDYECMTLC